MKKLILIISALLMITLITSCENANQIDNQGNAEYDTTVFNVPMREALKASQNFVKQSVKASADRSAFVELEEDDKWEGFINNGWGGNWNVPSNIYGTSLDTADNTLVINGEELGKLQNLVFHKENINGQDCFTKAVFEYKGFVYYVRDFDTGNGSYIVLSSEDDLDHICFTQDGKTNSPDFSNFKIWVWEKDIDGNLFRSGNLGYAYTLRNVQMLDGSYATVTVSGFNYYFYGMRVWIQETDGKVVKKDYPGDSNQPDPIFQEEGYIELDLSTIADQIKDCDSAHIERSVKGSDKWDTVMYYYANNGKKLDTTIKLTDYYTDEGIEYSYRMNAWGANVKNPIDLGTYKAEKGLGDLKYISGAATYDETEHALVFTEIPSFEPKTSISRWNPSFELRYCLEDGNGSGWIYFDIDDIKDNKLPIKKAYEIEKYLGKKMIPGEEWYQIYENISENCTLCWRAETNLIGKETSYPSFTVPTNQSDFMHVPANDLDSCLVETGYDFIYEVVNDANNKNTFTVRPFISDSKIYQEEGPYEAVLSICEGVQIKPGNSYQFKFKISALKEKYGDEIDIGCYFQMADYNESRGWMNSFYGVQNRKHTVTLIETENWWDGENSWSDL